MSIDYAAVLAANYSGKRWILNGDDYEGLEWHDDSPMPTRDELDSQWSEVQAEMKAEAEARVDARVTALAKLSALGLSEVEIQALLG